MCTVVEFFVVRPGKSLCFQHFSPDSLWTNLWIMWKTTVEKDVENVEGFILCKLIVMVNYRLSYDGCAGAGAPERLPPGGKLAKISDF